MTPDDWLRSATQRLEAAGIGTARLDALVLLEDTLGMDRARLLAGPDTKIAPQKIAELEKLLKRRARHEPLAYVRGHSEFYGRTFVINSSVLEPRPESETMIELLKSLIETEQPHFKTDSPLRIADVGTGSGALGITAVLEVPGTVVDLLDIDQKALETAKINVDKLTSGMTVTQSDLLRSADRHYDVLLCNLPYVPDDYQLNLAAGHEPKIAIFGGPDGLDIYRQLFKQVEKLTKQPLFILTEALPPQHAALDSIANQSGYSITQSEDFIQVFRVQKKALWAKNLSYFMMRPA